MERTKVILYGVFLIPLLSLGTACQKSDASATTSSVTPAATVAAPPLAKSAEDSMPRVTVEEAKAQVANGTAVLVDVRGPDAYKLGHIKGSLEHSLGKMEGNDFKGLPKDKRIIAYCSCPAEHSSARAAYLLQQGGFKDAGCLVGGNAAWEAAGGEMVKAPAATPEPAAKAKS
ncbi:MAG: rhodanese-like domain-containing protein [Acidobacteria bacterium]|nr:rhodanese-like domain-containing protein [Acidobacteriota bacterium]